MEGLIPLELVPDVLTPEQWYGVQELDTATERIMFAILNESLNNLRDDDIIGRDAYRWFRSDVDQWGSFVFVCDLLNFDRWKWRRIALEIWLKRTRYTKLHVVPGGLQLRVPREPRRGNTRRR